MVHGVEQELLTGHAGIDIAMHVAAVSNHGQEFCRAGEITRLVAGILLYGLSKCRVL